ncbi:cytochrome P450 [Roridomyces roridus]|uniref:Cytochrome P450 n=1 Tax=Roridomyces roridus TaxID=1738132 RepID=A0AAD7BD06_9AGAR|nr:cytochrome P450 [Roridomyces roridus]
MSHPLLWWMLPIVALCFYWLVNSVGPKLPLPPGPRKLPIIGNLLDFRGLQLPLWEVCMRWSRQYNSDIIHLNLAGTSIIILSSLEAAEALLDKRSSIYSDRPVQHMMELMGFGFLLGSRTQRRLCNGGLNAAAAKSFRPQQRTAAHALIRRILHSPEAFLDHIRLMAGELIIPLTYSIDVQPVDDPYIALAKASIECTAQVVPGRFFVDFLPLLKYAPEWMPGSGFQRIARQGRVLSDAVRNAAFDECQRCITSGDAKPSFVSQGFDQKYQETTVKDAAAAMYMAGLIGRKINLRHADTTVSALYTFFLAMLANPDAQVKAQREIDLVVQEDHLPDFGDQEEMPYVAALVKEVLRWKVVLLVGIPHFLRVEDEYRGYRIPAKAILHDETMYPDPHIFKPERFLLNGKLNPAVKDPQAAFGFGRRVCPGRHLAESSMWIAVVSILAVFDISKAVGENGQVHEPSYEYGDGILSSPVPFICLIRPRSEPAAKLVEATFLGEI